MSLCDNTCRACIYHSTITGVGIVCNYILDNYMPLGERMRGCPAGKGCTQRIIERKKPSIDSLIFRGKPKEKDPEQERIKREKKKEYQHEWYLRHKDAKKESQRKRANQEKTRAICQGRQAQAIEDYLTETGISLNTLALMVGVTKGTIRNWKLEYNAADWSKLAHVGITKPEGL